MKKEIAICDYVGCKKECDKDDTIFFCTGRSSDGIEMSNDGKYIDLCSGHKTLLLRKIIKEEPYENIQKYCNWIKGEGKS